jgi:hypothetical protein
MYRQGLVVAALLGTLCLAGCASNGSRMAKRDLKLEVDEGKVVAVNEWGRTHGAVIEWVNFPVKNANAKE